MERNRETVKAIREVDPHHIIFLEGNYWSQDFSEMDMPFAPNIAYSPHYYNPAATRAGSWPMEIGGVVHDRRMMDRDVAYRDAFMKKYDVPVWMGEFGTRRYPDLEDKNRVLKDYIESFEELGHSWCYWCFKDLGLRGPLYLKPESEWARFTKPIRELKIKYHTDRAHTDAKSWRYEQFLQGYQEGEFELSKDKLAELLDRNIRETLSDQLTLTFAKQIADLSVADIDRMTDSFRFENCLIYEPWANIFKAAGKKR